MDAAENHQHLINSRIEMMRGYAETTGCRRQYLLGYFGEQLIHPCGNCGTCEAGPAEEQTARDEEFPRAVRCDTPSGDMVSSCQSSRTG